MYCKNVEIPLKIRQHLTQFKHKSKVHQTILRKILKFEVKQISMDYLCYGKIFETSVSFVKSPIVLM